MKKLLLLLFVVLTGCYDPFTEPKMPDINTMKKPCIVIAVKRDAVDAGFHGGFGSIIIKTADGIYVTFDGNSQAGQALVNSLNVGDTIK